MKRMLTILGLLLITLAIPCLAAERKVEPPPDCVQCGMNRTTFAHSRMMVTYRDGSTAGVCSLNCAVVDMQAAKGKKVKSLQVADYNGKQLLNAKKAVWVIGGSKKGVMSPVAKWAFADKKGAEAFVKENGGTLATFDEALKAAEKEQAGGEMHQHGGHKM